jgi:hypothetical protein
MRDEGESDQAGWDGVRLGKRGGGETPKSGLMGALNPAAARRRTANAGSRDE